jgi:prepilin-type N-terminal cleavage/methylation domain-containing protein
VRGPGEGRLTGDRGTTLTELTVAMVVFGLFATLLATTALQATRLTRESLVRERTAQTASLVMAQVSRDLRTAVRVGPSSESQTAFAAASPSEVVFFSSVEPTVVRQRLHETAAGWQRETTLPDVGSSFPNLLFTSTDPSRTTTRRVAPTELEVTCVFRYLLSGSATPLESVAAGDLDDIVAVQVHVSVDGDGPGDLSAVVLENTVRPYNL